MIKIRDFKPEKKEYQTSNNITRSYYLRQDDILLNKINVFIKKKNIEVINTETIYEEFNSYTSMYYLRLWYKENKIPSFNSVKL
jgi:hypothetical protein